MRSEKIQIRPIARRDRDPIERMLASDGHFHGEEVHVALELVDLSISDPSGSGYESLVAEEAGGALGYICYGRTPMTAHTYDLYWIVVEKSAQGKGVGQRLHEAMVEMIQSRGGKIIRIETSSTELYGSAQRFYERAGYTLTSRIPDFYKDGDDLLTFTRRSDR
ncbi:MAG: GNAT family N-acetyltransferase [Deltaproteobacteria bacterium]|nr:GNAT family N-acetyltransferase [Deltaproteobacteria bacterium]